ncbi:MAG: hypothetical protein RLZZ312_1260 [Bacteroidota bacterium]
MDRFFIAIIFLFSSFFYGQSGISSSRYTANNKGKFFVFWGGNNETYSKSDIRFVGKIYDFTLYDVTAADRPKGWHIDYLNPARMTIPQTNLKIGYYVNNHYNVAIGVDHMKYVMNQNVPVSISGNYPNPGSYGELLPNNQVLLTPKFLAFEHTDGLNFVNIEVSRIDDFSSIFRIKNTDKIQINLTEGLGLGFLYPKTNAELLGGENYDDYNVAGFGVSAKVGLNITFFKYFFIQTELKGGYIEMNAIRTTENPDDRAMQNFYFFQKIVAFGGIFRL